MRVSVAAVVKNEASTIEQVLRYIRPHVDEIVVGVDEQSSDGTQELVEGLADKVVATQLSAELASKKPTGNNTDWGFSQARNLVLSACDPDSWRLTLDGHEMIEGGEHLREIAQVANQADNDSVELELDFEPDENGIPRLQYRQVRLMAPHVRYRNPIHNVPVTTKTMFAPQSRIVHLKSRQAAEARNERDHQRTCSTIGGLELKAKETPNEPRCWFYLANSYKDNGRWLDAIDSYSQYLKIATWREERWQARVAMGTCHSMIGEATEAREQFSRALDEFPAMAEAYYWLGALAYKQQRFREAIVWLEKACSMSKPNCRLFTIPKIYMSDRWDMLAMAYHHVGEWAKAITAAKKSVLANKSERIKKNIDTWQRELDKCRS